MMSRLSSLWHNLAHRRRVEQDLDDEVRAALGLMVDEKLRAGMRIDAARRAAALEMGGVEAVKEQVRNVRAGALVDALQQDVRYGARTLWRQPLFALTATLSIAIGIGANTTIFTIANALLFHQPAGVTEPDRLVDIGTSNLQNGSGLNPDSYPNYLDIRQRATTLEGVYGYALFDAPMSLGRGDGVERIFSSVVTANYFAVLGARAAAGRLFSAADAEQLGAPPVVVLSYRFWARRFSQNPAIVGQTLQLNGGPFTVVGVASEGFHGTRINAADVWVPVTTVGGSKSEAASNLTLRDTGWLMMGGRLKPGITVAQAGAELDAIGRALEREYPEQNRGNGLRAQALSPVPGTNGVIAIFLALLMGIVSIVLVIACANVAGVLLARAAARQREIAVRVAMGAGRARLVRQLLTETILLYAVGGGTGLLLARGMTSLLLSGLPALPFPVDVSLALDGRALTFTAGLSLVAALLSGLAPALQATQVNVVPALKADTQALPGRSQLRNAFVVAQVALSLVLVISAGLFARALQRVGPIDPGFDPHGVELASVDLSLAGFTGATGPGFARALLDRVRALPEVRMATIAGILPGGFEGLGFGLTAPGVVPPNGARVFSAAGNIVEPGYFATMRIPLVAGRDFSAADSTGAPTVAVVSEAVARRFWPGQSAVGKSVVQPVFGPGTPPDTWKTLLVIGVARDVTANSLVDGLTPLFVYVPLQQQYMARITIVARTTHGQRIADQLRRVAASMSPALPIVTSQTLEEYTALGHVPQRVAASVSGSLGLVGLLLAAIGIYGITAYTVTRRTREIGIRLALGARRADVVGLVVRQGMSLAAVGCVIGLALAAAASRLLASFLFGVAPLDPATFGAGAILLVAIALGACYVPVRRATRIGPMEALRYE